MSTISYGIDYSRCPQFHTSTIWEGTRRELDGEGRRGRGGGGGGGGLGMGEREGRTRPVIGNHKEQLTEQLTDVAVLLASL